MVPQGRSLAGGTLLFVGPTAQSVTPGQPFEAEYEETAVEGPGGRPKRVVWGKIAVSRDGRVRDENHGTGLAQIVNPRSGDWVHVDVRTGRVRLRTRVPALHVPPSGGAPVTPQPERAAPLAHTESLGEREIEALLCYGVRMRAQGPDGEFEQESWTSRELGMIVRWRYTTARVERTYRLTSVRRGDPDPALFAALV